MELFRREIMCNLKYDDHVSEHSAINTMFNVDCDNVSVEEHLSLHLEYQYRTGKLTKTQYDKYKATNR